MDSHAKNDETANHNEVCINHCAYKREVLQPGSPSPWYFIIN